MYGLSGLQVGPNKCFCSIHTISMLQTSFNKLQVGFKYDSSVLQKMSRVLQEASSMLQLMSPEEGLV